MAVILVSLLQIASLLLIARAILSWIPIGSDSPLSSIRSFVFNATEPVLAPVRQVLPRVGGIDLSVFVVLIVISVVLTPIAGRL